MSERVSNATVEHMAAERGGDMFMWRSAALDLLDARRERDELQDRLSEIEGDSSHHTGLDLCPEEARCPICTAYRERDEWAEECDKRGTLWRESERQLADANKALVWLDEHGLEVVWPNPLPDLVKRVCREAAAARAAEGEKTCDAR